MKHHRITLAAVLTVAALQAQGGLAVAATDASTTQPYVIGRVVVRDPRILDVSGRYDLPGSSHSLTLGIIQSPRGDLSCSATVRLADGRVTGPLPLVGRLFVRETTGPLEFAAGNVPLPDAPQPEVLTSRPLVAIQGVLRGGGFDCRIAIHNFPADPGEVYRARLVPVKTMRGAVIADSFVSQVSPGVFASLRTVQLPWGSTSLPAVQRKLEKGILFRLPESIRRSMPSLFRVIRMELLGTVADAGFQTYRNTVWLGYGVLAVRPEDTLVTPHQNP